MSRVSLGILVIGCLNLNMLGLDGLRTARCLKESWSRLPEIAVDPAKPDELRDCPQGLVQWGQSYKSHCFML